MARERKPLSRAQYEETLDEVRDAVAAGTMDEDTWRERYGAIFWTALCVVILALGVDQWYFKGVGRRTIGMRLMRWADVVVARLPASLRSPVAQFLDTKAEALLKAIFIPFSNVSAKWRWKLLKWAWDWEVCGRTFVDALIPGDQHSTAHAILDKAEPSTDEIVQLAVLLGPPDTWARTILNRAAGDRDFYTRIKAALEEGEQVEEIPFPMEEIQRTKASVREVFQAAAENGSVPELATRPDRPAVRGQSAWTLP